MQHFLKAARLTSVVCVQISVSQLPPPKARVYFLPVLHGTSQHAAACRLLLPHSLLPLLEAGEAAGTLHVGGCGRVTLATAQRPLSRGRFGPPGEAVVPPGARHVPPQRGRALGTGRLEGTADGKAGRKDVSV